MVWGSIQGLGTLSCADIACLSDNVLLGLHWQLSTIDVGTCSGVEFLEDDGPDGTVEHLCACVAGVDPEPRLIDEIINGVARRDHVITGCAPE